MVAHGMICSHTIDQGRQKRVVLQRGRRIAAEEGMCHCNGGAQGAQMSLHGAGQNRGTEFAAAARYFLQKGGYLEREGERVERGPGMHVIPQLAHDAAAFADVTLRTALGSQGEHREEG